MKRRQGKPATEIVGQRFGRLTVLKQAPAPEFSKVKGAIFWEVECVNLAVHNNPVRFVKANSELNRDQRDGRMSQCRFCGAAQGAQAKAAKRAAAKK